MVVNDHSPTRITTRSHEIPNYGPEQLKFEIDDYRKKMFSWKTGWYKRKFGKTGQELIYYSKKALKTIQEFVSFNTCNKLIWIQDEGSRTTNKTIKKGSNKTHFNEISSS